MMHTVVGAMLHQIPKPHHVRLVAARHLELDPSLEIGIAQRRQDLPIGPQ